MDYLRRHGKERVWRLNWQYGSIEELVHCFLHYSGLSVEETLRKAGILSEDYWLQSNKGYRNIPRVYRRKASKSAKNGWKTGPDRR